MDTISKKTAIKLIKRAVITSTLSQIDAAASGIESAIADIDIGEDQDKFYNSIQKIIDGLRDTVGNLERRRDSNYYNDIEVL